MAAKQKQIIVFKSVGLCEKRVSLSAVDQLDPSAVPLPFSGWLWSLPAGEQTSR